MPKDRKILMTKPKRSHSPGRPIWFVFAGIAILTLVLSVMLRGKDIAVMNPQGYVAQGEFYLIVFTMALLLVIAVPTIALLYYFAWKYRETNETSTYDPKTPHSKRLVFSMWAVPSIFMIILSLVLWPATHKYEPQKPLAEGVKPLRVQVVAMRWKWLFIYPDHNVATVNFVQIPTNTPVQFELTADETPMSSFWIPHLSGQLYAMTGHINKLNIIAGQPGDYPGSTAEINGSGFAGMRFTARASSQQEFNDWVLEVQKNPTSLTAIEYDKLLKPSEKVPVRLYSKPDADLYDKMLMKYAGSHDHQPEKYEAGH